jgi:hypothetical protein
MCFFVKNTNIKCEHDEYENVETNPQKEFIGHSEIDW